MAKGRRSTVERQEFSTKQHKNVSNTDKAQKEARSSVTTTTVIETTSRVRGGHVERFEYREDDWERSPKTDYTYAKSGIYSAGYMHEAPVSPNMSRRSIRLSSANYKPDSSTYVAHHAASAVVDNEGEHMQISSDEESLISNTNSSIIPNSTTRAGTPYSWRKRSQDKLNKHIKRRSNTRSSSREDRYYEEQENLHSSTRGQYSGETRESNLTHLYGLDEVDGYSDDEGDSNHRDQVSMVTTLWQMITSVIITAFRVLTAVVVYPFNTAYRMTKYTSLGIYTVITTILRTITSTAAYIVNSAANTAVNTAEYAANTASSSAEYASNTAASTAKYAANTAASTTEYAANTAEYAANTSKYAANTAVNSATKTAAYATRTAGSAAKAAAKTAKSAAKSAASRVSRTNQEEEKIEYDMDEYETYGKNTDQGSLREWLGWKIFQVASYQDVDNALLVRRSSRCCKVCYGLLILLLLLPPLLFGAYTCLSGIILPLIPIRSEPVVPVTPCPSDKDAVHIDQSTIRLLESQESRLNTLEAQLASMVSNLQLNSGDVTNIKQQININDNHLQSRMSDIEAGMSAYKLLLDELALMQQNMSSCCSNNTAAIAAVQAMLPTLTDQHKKLSDDITGLAGDIVTVNQQVHNVNQQLHEKQDPFPQINVLNTKLEELAASQAAVIAGAKQGTSDGDDKLQAVLLHQGDIIQSLRGDINQLEQQRQDMAANMALLQAQLQGMASDPTVNETLNSLLAAVAANQECCKNGGGGIMAGALGGGASDGDDSDEGGAIGVGLAGLSDGQIDQVKTYIKEALLVYGADKTGMVDYALESAGGSIVSTRCTETYRTTTAVLTVFGLPIWYMSQSPRTLIQPTVQPGECWAFKGHHGTVVIKLVGPIKISSFSLEHIPKTLSPTGNITSAPQDFSVWGMNTENDPDRALLGKYRYNQDGEPLQLFPIQKLTSEPFMYVELEVLTNHGHPEYTCLYRFRVHGRLL